jgi:hypothetical protein
MLRSPDGMIRFSPYPLGKSFAVTFVDDTDLSTRANTEPVYDLLAHHRFWGTKTVWALRAKRNSAFRRDLERAVPQRDSGSTLEDEDYTNFVRKIQDQGFEIALHGVAAGNSNREEIVAGLAHFGAVLGQPPTMNVFHQTNVENLYCGAHKLDSRLFQALERATDGSDYEGHREGSPSFWGDIVRETFRYVRLPFHTIDEVNTLRANPSMPFHDPRRPYVRRWFASSDGSDVVRFNRLLSEKNIRRLAHQRGACIVYTHFAKGFARKDGSRFRLDDEFVKTVERVTGAAGVWFTTASKLLDRLAAVNALSLRHEGHQLQINNNGDSVIEGVVMQLPAGLTVASLSGAPLDGGGGFVVLPELAIGAALTLATNRAGTQLVQQKNSVVNRRERRLIEYRNYLGLLRGAVKDRLHYSPFFRPTIAPTISSSNP